MVLMKETVKEQRDESSITCAKSRLRNYENSTKEDESINEFTPYIVKLEAKQLPHGFERPYDARLHTSMSRATADLVQTFHATSGYTHRQSIYLAFLARSQDSNRHPFAEKKLLASVLSSYTSMRFLYHLMKMNYNQETEQYLIKRIQQNPHFYFNATIFNVPTQSEALNYFVNVSIFESFDKSALDLATQYFPKEKLKNLKTSQIVRKLFQEKKVSYDQQPVGMKSGTFVKRAEVVGLASSKLQSTKNEDFEAAPDSTETEQDKNRPQLVISPYHLQFKPVHIDFLFGEYWPNTNTGKSEPKSMLNENDKSSSSNSNSSDESKGEEEEKLLNANGEAKQNLKSNLNSFDLETRQELVSSIEALIQNTNKYQATLKKVNGHFNNIENEESNNASKIANTDLVDENKSKNSVNIEGEGISELKGEEIEDNLMKKND